MVHRLRDGAVYEIVVALALLILLLAGVIFLAGGCDGAGGRGPDAGDVGDAGRCSSGACWNGSTCLEAASQTDEACLDPVTGLCARTSLACSGFRGSCDFDQEAAQRGRCHPDPTMPGGTRAVCCPANVCTFDACR